MVAIFDDVAQSSPIRRRVYSLSETPAQRKENSDLHCEDPH